MDAKFKTAFVMLYNLFLNSWGCSKKGWSMWSVWDAATVEDACDDVRRILTKSAAPLSACLVPLLCAQKYAFLLLSQPSFACCLPSPPASLSVRLFSLAFPPLLCMFVLYVRRRCRRRGDNDQASRKQQQQQAFSLPQRGNAVLLMSLANNALTE